MGDGGTIGAATPVQMGQPGAPAQPVEEKTVSYVRKEFRATAEARKRPPLIAEAMVDADVEIPDLIEKGKLLTLTTDEALKHKIAEFRADTMAAVLKPVGACRRRGAARISQLGGELCSLSHPSGRQLAPHDDRHAWESSWRFERPASACPGLSASAAWRFSSGATGWCSSRGGRRCCSSVSALSCSRLRSLSFRASVSLESWA